MKKRVKRRSSRIRYRILTACVGLVVVGLALSGLVIQSIYKQAQISSTQANGRVLVEQIAGNISVRAGEYSDIVLREVQTVGLFEKYVNNPSSDDYYNRRVVTGIVNQQNTSRSPIQDFYVRNRLGEWSYFNYSTQLLRGENPEVMAYAEQFRQEIPRGAVWKSFDSAPDSVYMMRTIFSTSSLRDEGVVVVGIDKAIFEEQFRSLEEHEKVRILILNDKDEVLFGNDGDLPLHTLLETAQTVPSPLVTVEGAQYLICQQQTKDKMWRVAYIVGEDTLFAPIRKMQYTIILTCIVTLVAAALAAAGISSGLTASIRSLCMYIQRIQKGELSQKAPVSNDEMGMVAEAFNEMSLHLQDTVEDLTQQKLETEQAEYRALQAEYHALQAAVNPHFIFNAMDSINAAAKLEGQDKIASVCTALGRLMRVAISRNKAMVPLREELGYIKDYLKVQRFMMGDRLEVAFELEDAANNCIVPALLLQPLVENAVIHGIESLSEGAVIYITTELCAPPDAPVELLVQISDNGVGMDAQTLRQYSDLSDIVEDSGHFGIRSVQKRINILYGPQYGIAVTSDECRGTVVRVRIPFQTGQTGGAMQ